MRMSHPFVKIQLDVNLFLPLRKKAIMEIFTNDKNIQNKLNRSEFQELLSYFKGLRESVILREIRKKFPDHKHLDKDLEFLIAHGIVSRQDRRYELGLPIITDYPTSGLVEHFIQKTNKEYSAEDLLVWLSEEHWNNGLEKMLAVDFPMPSRYCLENAEFRLVTINSRQELSETLPNYFGNSDEPSLFPNLAGLIGDVNPEFFTNQLNLILERVLAGKAPRRTSIFLKSLIDSGVIAERPEWHVSIPVYDKNFLVDPIRELDNDAAFFFSRQLAERLLDKQESFTYLMKKKA